MMTDKGIESPYGEWLENWVDKPEDAERLTTSVECAEFFPTPRPGADRARHPGRPDRSLVRLPDRAAAEAWPTEDFQLARSEVPSTLPESDLFAGIR